MHHKLVLTQSSYKYFSKSLKHVESTPRKISPRSCRPYITQSQESAKLDIAPGRKKYKAKLKERLEERDLFLNILSATTTKRDAKSYLSRFKQSSGMDINAWDVASEHDPQLRVSLFKLRAPQKLPDEVLAGLAHTLSQLRRLGLVSVILLDCDLDTEVDPQENIRQLYYEQGNRVVSFLLKEIRAKACYLDSIIAVDTNSGHQIATVPVRGHIEVQFGDILHKILTSDTIPVIPALGHSKDNQRVIDIRPDDAILALIRQFSHINKRDDSQSGTSVHTERDHANFGHDKIVLDRLILVDPQGGLPSLKRLDNAHSFVNLEQEYETIRQEMLDRTSDCRVKSAMDYEEASSYSQKLVRGVKNLDLVQKALTLLPPSSSAMITSPWDAATPPAPPAVSAIDLGVSTRRPKNPLIYNLLTDKPLISSSLPTNRLGFCSSSPINPVQPISSTFVKKGMPLTIIPDPQKEPWQPPGISDKPLNLNDPRIDFPRLLNLIEDSFNRPLDVQHYLHRIQNKVAGIIVAGEYEGGAILTWELPPGVEDDGSADSRQRMVPYLDKFAVLKRSQGAGGVADIVFTAMVLNCFPKGLCWRSRKNNPVNKWYFERSIGTMKLSDSQWTMFWTTENLLQDRQRLLDYEGVCRTVQPSWADNKAAID